MKRQSERERTLNWDQAPDETSVEQAEEEGKFSMFIRMIRERIDNDPTEEAEETEPPEVVDCSENPIKLFLDHVVEHDLLRPLHQS